MLIDYYKVIIIGGVLQSYRRFKLKLAGHNIQKGVIISKSSVFHGNNIIGSNTIIGNNTILGKNAKIGRDSIIGNIIVGENSHVESGVIVTGCGKGKIVIGKECYIGINNILDYSNNITIGDYVHIAGPSTGLWTHSSAMQCHNGLPLIYKGEEFRPTAPIVLANNVYIGGNCTIYPGVTIGHHSIVAPNSAVTKNVKPYSMMGGVPAKKIKNIEL